MKKIYWRPQRAPVRVLLILVAAAAAGLVSVETFRVREVEPHFKEKLDASRLTLQAFAAVKKERLRRGLYIDPAADPAQTGLVGELLSPVTTNPGHLTAKQCSANPNFAAVIVHLLKRAEVGAGDGVAVALSGSFPALNIAVLAAVQTLRAKAIVISSAGASQWGANTPGFMWPDMERLLNRERMLSTSSVAVSMGGIDDRALGMSKAGKQMILDSIVRNGMMPLEVKSYVDGLETRMALYREHSTELEIKAYVNVGGGTTSVGTHVGKHLFKPGLNRRAPRGANIDSVMMRFVTRGVPVIHLVRIEELAQRFGLPVQPKATPRVGEGKIFAREVYNLYLTALVLVGLVALLFAFLRMDWGYRLFRTSRREADPSRPAQMV